MRCFVPPTRTTDARRQGQALPSKVVQAKPMSRLAAGWAAPSSAAAAPVAAPSRTGLPGGLRAGVEALSGCSLADVRVHRDSARPGRLGALAYTEGSEIHLATAQGRQLPHEAWHVVQQKQGRVRATRQMNGAPINDDPSLEAEADRMGKASSAAGLRARTDFYADFRAEAPAAVSAPVKQLRSADEGTGAQQGGETEAESAELRRIPELSALEAALPMEEEEGFQQARTGLARVLSRAWADLDAEGQGFVQGKAQAISRNSLDEAGLLDGLNGASRAELLAFAGEMLRAKADLKFGDPKLMDIPPRGAEDLSNLKILAGEANSVFDAIEGGAWDCDLGEVFGPKNIEAAKKKYRKGRAQLARFMEMETPPILADRSGYSQQVRMAGLSNRKQISIRASFIDQPRDAEAVVKFIHECLHAGNREVTDFCYLGRNEFPTLSEKIKLKNAAHFEVVPGRIKGAKAAYENVTFSPAGKGGTAKRTPAEKAISLAYNAFRNAWTAGLNLHGYFVRLFQSPGKWVTSKRLAGALPFWSKVEALTIHTRLSSIKPPSADASAQPVTIIDLALSEGLVAKLAKGMDLVPDKPEPAEALKSDSATTEELAEAAKGIEAEADLLVKLVLRKHLGGMTGDIVRDQTVVKLLADAGKINTEKEYLRGRDPSSIP